MAISTKRVLLKVVAGWLFLFFCWLGFQFLNPNPELEKTRIYDIVTLSIMPGILVSESFGPQGRDIGTILTGTIMAMIFSVALYAGVSWLIVRAVRFGSDRFRKAK